MAIIIQHPAMANRRAAAQQERASNPNGDRGTQIPTRELKVHIAIIELVLRIPASAPTAIRSRRVRSAMGQRLRMYQAELQVRDARRAAPLDHAQLSQRVSEFQLRHAM